MYEFLAPTISLSMHISRVPKSTFPTSFPSNLDKTIILKGLFHQTLTIHLLKGLFPSNLDDTLIKGTVSFKPRQHTY